MKKIYVSHANDFNFQGELYEPIRSSKLNSGYTIVLPHEKSDELFPSKAYIWDECDVFVVEASFPKIGVGVEVGWADSYGKPIIAMYRKGTRSSTSLKSMCAAVIEYESPDEMIRKRFPVNWRN